jgi:hypothetical protein
MAERQALFDAVFVGSMDPGATPQSSTPLGPFCLHQVSSAGTEAKHFPAGGDLESLGGGLLCFNALRTSHKSSGFF